MKNTIDYEPKRRYLPPNIIANTVVSEKYMGIPIQTMCPIHLVICIWYPYCVKIVRFSYTDVCGVVIRPTTKSVSRWFGDKHYNYVYYNPMGNIHSCFTHHKACVLCHERFTEYYIVCANCKKTMHDECEYTFNRRNYSDCCPACGQEARIYYKFDV